MNMRADRIDIVQRKVQRAIEDTPGPAADVAAEVMDAILRSSLVKDAVRDWYIAQVCLDQAGEN